MCYTYFMVENPHIWHTWARNLHRWGVEEGAATLLDAAGPLTMLLAQFVYISQPLLGRLVSPESMDALTNMLEEPAQTKAFVEILREAS
ncbi:MAG: hypothetical protein A2Z49_06435 [Chloroflexi bacterium RBG_19FT_COMBO_56_12]|nr:MAG: hypothetical protein A2W36_04755 [Chloroflexi bacterium RBG_16_58_14]OGO72820.1 MAG: hypothetical protein A2Z49_06435 [Chloroflexi bacterium RBG_19FT_COMBO_56_12]